MKSHFRLHVLICLAALTVLTATLADAAEVFANSSDLSDQRDRVGRDFRNLSIHPNGVDIAIVECSFELVPQGNCYLLRYNCVTGQLWRYVFPDDYLVTEASFSPRGNFLVISREPRRTDESEKAIQQQVEGSQIAFMRTDGSELKALSLSAGLKVGPAMSPDERKIGYWRGSMRPTGSKSFASKYDIWETSLNGQDELFAGPFRFFERSNLQYIDGNNVLIHAWGPQQYARSMSDYSRGYQNSSVYVIQRHAGELPPPSFTDVEFAEDPSTDVYGRIYVRCQIPHLGPSFCRRNTDSSLTKWLFPRGRETTAFMVASPTGGFAFFISPLPRTDIRDHKRMLGVLDTASGEWKEIHLPPLAASTAIDVKSVH